MISQNAVCRSLKSETVVRLSSGLGNQLFQLARGMALAEHANARLCYDTTWFGLVAGLHPVKRQIRLPELGVPLPEAFRGPRRLIIGLLAAFFDKTRRGKSLLSALGKMHVIQESTLHSGSNVDFATVNTGRIYLNGYWQTNGPFILVRNALLPMLRPKTLLSSGAKALIAKAESNDTGFIHVRRGDYIHFMGEKGVLPVCYYSRALAKVQEMGKKVARWMIFSEDTDWARANLGFVLDAEVIDYESSSRDIEDLMIMKTCCTGIIANSSYSWWGGALGDREDRPVIAPDRYWKHSNQSVTSWALPNWTQVQAWD